MMRRVFVIFLSSMLVLSQTITQASAASYYMRNVNGIHVNSPVLGLLQFGWNNLHRANPYVTALSIGVTVAGIVVKGTSGTNDIPIKTRGQADAERTDVTNPLTPYYTNQLKCSNAGAGSGAPVTSPSECPLAGHWGFCINTHVAHCIVTTTATGAGYDIRVQHPDQGVDVTYSADWQHVCSTGSSIAHAGQGPGTCAQVGNTLQGGTKSWAPRLMDLLDGTTVAGWERPSDPLTPSSQFGESPADQWQWAQESPAPVGNTTKPETIFTPNKDGGYTIQSWAPVYNTAGGVTTQTGWTIQTTTINNAGAITTNNIVNITGAASVPAPGSVPVTDGTGKPPEETPPEPTECGSLSCESTQQELKTELIANAAPTLPDQSASIAASKTADKGLSDGQATAAQAGDGINWFAWVWTPPAGSCTAPTASVGGFSVSFDYCPGVVWVKAILGWLFAVFGSWHIWNVLFRRD